MKFSYLLASAGVLLALVSCGQRPSQLDESFNEANIYDLNRDVISQQFDMDKDGNLYYAQINPKATWGVNLYRVVRDSLNHRPQKPAFRGDSALVCYAGHPTGMAVEDAPDGAYVWLSSYSSRIPSGSYWDTQTVARFRFQADSTYIPTQLEQYWFPHAGNLNVALDQKNDQIAFCFYRVDQKEAGIPHSKSRRVRIYKLSEVLAAPVVERELHDWIRGGEGQPFPELDTVALTARVHDLSDLVPIAEIGTHTGSKNPMGVNATAWQGFDIDDGIVWFSEGGGRSGTFVTGYDFEGNVVFDRTPVYMSFPCPEWDVYEISDTLERVVENEGVRVWKGDLYLGMFSIRADSGWRSGVFRFPLPKVSDGPAALTGFTYPSLGESLAQNPLMLHGNYQNYPFVEADCSAPAGYEPVYVSHFGRHGSRTYDSASGYDYIHDLYGMAAQKNALTDLGRRFWEEYEPMYMSGFKDKAGSLTPFGEAEITRLGREMASDLPSLFVKGKKVDARSTIIPRVVHSMNLFCDALAECAPEVEISRCSDTSYMSVIRPVHKVNPDVKQFDMDNLSIKGRWGDDYMSMRNSGFDTLSFVSKSFTDASLIYMKKGYRARDYAQILYNICAGAICLDPQNRWLEELFTTEEAAHFWRFTNLKFYGMAGPSGYSVGRCWALMRNLLQDVIDGAEEGLTSDLSAHLRFGHDYEIASFLALLDAEGWNTLVAEPELIEQVFRYDRIPMASNIRFIFYRNDSGNVLVRALYNDRDLKLPVKTVRGGFYEWEQMKAFFEQRVQTADWILSR